MIPNSVVWGRRNKQTRSKKSKMTETRQRNCASQEPLRGRPQHSGGKGFHPMKGSKRGQLVCTTQCAEPVCACHLQRGGGSSLRTNQKTGLPKAQQGKEREDLISSELQSSGDRDCRHAWRPPACPPAWVPFPWPILQVGGHVSMPRKTGSLGHRKRH